VTVGQAREARAAQLDQLGRRCRIEEAPRGERDRQVVHHRRATEHRGAPQADAQAARDRIVGRLAGHHVQAGAERVGDLDREALVGSLVAHAAALGLEPVDLGRPIGHPPIGHMIGRGVTPGVIGR
jgi:hypothetical protein